MACFLGEFFQAYFLIPACPASEMLFLSPVFCQQKRILVVAHLNVNKTVQLLVLMWHIVGTQEKFTEYD